MMVGFGMIEYGMVGFETVETETLGKVNQVHFVMVCKLTDMGISIGRTKSCLKCAINAWGSNPINNLFWLFSGSDVARSVVFGR